MILLVAYEYVKIPLQSRTEIVTLVDAHIHLTDAEFSPYIYSVITTLKAMKFRACSVSVDNQTSLASLDLLVDPELHNTVYTFIGIHPRSADHEDVVAFEQILSTHIQSVDGIGEIGLDRSYTENGFSSYHKQKEVFECMLRLAEKYRKPISVHSRKSLDEILQDISSYNIDAVLMHWFSGNKRQLNACMDRGYYVSYGPALLYSEDKKAMVRNTHQGSILIETDGPNRYSHCFGNYPALPSSFLVSVAKSVSEVLLMPYDEIVEMLSLNWSHFIKRKL
jgi:TatD DNase family protein